MPVLEDVVGEVIPQACQKCNVVVVMVETFLVVVGGNGAYGGGRSSIYEYGQNCCHPDEHAAPVRAWDPCTG